MTVGECSWRSCAVGGLGGGGDGGEGECLTVDRSDSGDVKLRFLKWYGEEEGSGLKLSLRLIKPCSVCVRGRGGFVMMTHK